MKKCILRLFGFGLAVGITGCLPAFAGKHEKTKDDLIQEYNNVLWKFENSRTLEKANKLKRFACKKYEYLCKNKIIDPNGSDSSDIVKRPPNDNDLMNQYYKIGNNLIEEYWSDMDEFKNSRTLEKAVRLQHITLKEYSYLVSKGFANPGDKNSTDIVNLPPDSYGLEKQLIKIKNHLIDEYNSLLGEFQIFTAIGEDTKDLYNRILEKYTLLCDKYSDNPSQDGIVSPLECSKS